MPGPFKRRLGRSRLVERRAETALTNSSETSLPSVEPTTRLNRRSGEPLWVQILADLQSRLDTGEFEERFPSDIELTGRYNVSRQTVREAVRRLHEDGRLERSRGRGTFVRPRSLEQTLGTIYSLYRSAEEQGFVQESLVRYLEERTDPVAAAALGCRSDEPLVYLERLRLIDSSPVVLDCSWLPKSIAAPILESDFHRTALYIELETRCGIRPDSGWEHVTPVMPSALQRELLGLRPRVPAYGVERLACQGDLKVEWRHGVVRADRFAFVTRWSGGRVGASFETPTTWKQ